VTDSRVPGIGSRAYIRYSCAECGYTIVGSEDDAICEKHGKMTPETTSTNERMSRIFADSQGS
jgi:hypothetical protein